jgi:TonB family protein
MKSFTRFIRVVCSICLLQTISFNTFSQVKVIMTDPQNPIKESSKVYDTVFVEQPNGDIMMKIEEHIPIKNKSDEIMNYGINPTSQSAKLYDTIYIEQSDGKVLTKFVKLDAWTLSKEEVYSKADNWPEFNGGEIALSNFLNQQMRYPVEDKKNKIEGYVILNFLIDEKGQLSEYKVLRNTSGSKSLEAEALRIIKIMPNWKPATRRDIPVKVSFTLPIQFSLKD